MPRSSAIPPRAVAPHDRERALFAAARPRGGGGKLPAAPARGGAGEEGPFPPPRFPRGRGAAGNTTPPARGLQRTPRSAARPSSRRRGRGSPSQAGSPLPAAPKGSAPSQRGARSPGAAGEERRGPSRPKPSGRRAVPRRGRDRPSIPRPVAKSRPGRARPAPPGQAPA